MFYPLINVLRQKKKIGSVLCFSLLTFKAPQLKLSLNT